MGGKGKLTLLVAVVALVPSVLQYLKGYLLITSLLLHVLFALGFALLAVTLLSAAIAVFKIQNLESAKTAGTITSRDVTSERLHLGGPGSEEN